jgi:subtilisin family serine protease
MQTSRRKYMSCKLTLLFFLLLITTSIKSQTTYFIKYKDTVDKTKIEEKVNTKQIFSTSESLRKINNNFDVKFFAKGLGKVDERLSKIVKVTFQKETDAQSFLPVIKNDYAIEYIQAANVYHIDYIPNDSLLNEQWALEKIKAFDAWDITAGEDTVLIGVIDTGIDYLHPDLADKLFINRGEIGMDNLGRDKSTNGVDDDGNGFIDDYRGWDFTDRVGFPFDTTTGDYLNWDNDPMDENNFSHGTAVAGIIGARTNNSRGIAGVAPNVKIINIRSFDPGGFGDEDDAAAAILYAVQMGVKVINMSFGDDSFSYVLRDVIRYAYSQNVVLVASAGNTNSDLPHYPSSYAEVISVGNSTQEDFVSGSSNYGSTIDLVAPGTQVATTIRNSAYSLDFSGTSAAAPFVSAAAGLILSIENFTNEEIRQIVKTTSDDINQPGWDDRSGAGRLNLFKALSVLAPAVVRFDSPAMDYATTENTLGITATALSPYFVSYNLEVGEGYNPTSWTTLVGEGKNQFLKEKIYNLDISNYKESVYTLKLIVFQNNGRNLEERINFHVIRTAPQVIEVRKGSFYYGDKSTIGGEFYTEQRCIMRLYYRRFGDAKFNFITLDGFNTNNQFVKQFHYGFIPKELVSPSTLYEVYFEAENLAGLKTRVLDTLNNLNYFLFETDNLPEITDYNIMPFSLPNGVLFKDPVSFLSNDSNEVFFQQFYASKDIYNGLYKLENNMFSKIDSMKNKIPRVFGDFNNNGNADLLSYWTRTGYIDEQTQPFTFQLETKTELDTSFYPITARDIDNDGRTEVITNIGDTLMRVYKLNDDLTISSFSNLGNYSFIDTFDSRLDFPNYIYRNAVITDLNGDRMNELWFADYDGDLLSYKILGPSNFQKGDSLITRFLTNSNNILSAGDFDGDGIEEIAVLYETNTIAPNFFLRIFNFKDNSLNILYEKVFLDQSAEFLDFVFNQVYQTLRFADINGDGNSELVLNIFPYLYILKYYPTGTKIIFYDEGVNSPNIFVGDINQNGVNEIAFQTAGGTTFYEFAISDKAITPYSLKGYSIDSTKINLSWLGIGDRFLIYKGTNRENLQFIDSTNLKTFEDNDIENNRNYYYSVQAYDVSKGEQYSNLSSAIEIYSHEPASIVSIANNNKSSLLINFSEKIKPTIENLRSFEVMNSIFPNSISAANQYSYLLSFNEELPVGNNLLIIKNLNDFYNSPIKEDTISFIVLPIETQQEFFIVSFEIINPFRIKLTFNLDVDESLAVKKDNYQIEPENKISKVEVDNTEKNMVYVNLDGKKPVGSIGREYRLRVINLKSSVESGSISINSGAGSFVVLTSFAENLSGVFVYPNPVNTLGGKVTFANLPKRAKINIFNLNGDRINEIEETDGNGGVDFNLTYESGEKLNTGIYIYRIVMLDDSDNEVEEKIGKFAVIK